MDDRLTLISSASLRQKWVRARARHDRRKKSRRPLLLIDYDLAGIANSWNLKKNEE